MAYNYYNQQNPFWDFVRSFDNGQGAGVDHPAEGPRGFFGQGPPDTAGPHPPPPPPFGGFGFSLDGPGFGPGHPSTWGPGGRRGRRHGREGPHDHADEHHGSRDASPNPEHEGSGEEGAGEGSADDAGPGNPERRGPRHGHGHHGPGGHHGRRGGWGGHGRGGWGGHARGGWGHGGWGRGGWPHHGRHGPGGPGGPGGAFDFSALIESLSAHPLAQAFRQYAERAGRSGETLVPEENEGENTFTPPIDVFSTPSAYILHVALPGAKKEDVGVNWDAEKGVLNLAGVVYRQGDEAFLKTLSQAERKVGVFERTVKLPPGAEEKEEVDNDAITAKLEDGVLIVTVPKVEKEWTEVKKVDIE